MDCPRCRVKMKTIFTNPIYKGTLRYRVNVCKTCGIVKETMEVPVEWLSKRYRKAIERGRQSRACVYKWLKQ